MFNFSEAYMMQKVIKITTIVITLVITYFVFTDNL